MKTVNEIWDYIVLHDLLYQYCPPSLCWVSKNQDLWVEYKDEDSNDVMVMCPFEVIERVDNSIADVTRDINFYSYNCKELSRRCNAVVINNYREHLKQQLSIVEGMSFESK